MDRVITLRPSAPTDHETVVAVLDHHANIDPWRTPEGPSDDHET
jgi:hypothetical protein